MSYTNNKGMNELRGKIPMNVDNFDNKFVD